MTQTESSSHPCRLWLTLEGSEIIELKQVIMDRDVGGTRAFFQRVVAPRVRRAAERRGIAIDASFQKLEEC